MPCHAATLALLSEETSAHSYFVASVQFSPDGAKIVSGSYDQSIKVWDGVPITRQSALEVGFRAYQPVLLRQLRLWRSSRLRMWVRMCFLLAFPLMVPRLLLETVQAASKCGMRVSFVAQNGSPLLKLTFHCLPTQQHFRC